jgi:hypothetical protein
MRRAAKTARKVARMPVYLWKNGKVVADVNAVSSPLLSSQSRFRRRRVKEVTFTRLLKVGSF